MITPGFIRQITPVRKKIKQTGENEIYACFTCTGFMAISLCGNWELQVQESKVNHRK